MSFSSLALHVRDTSDGTLFPTSLNLQILPRLLTLKANMKLQHSKVSLSTVKQKEILSLLILGLHVIHNQVCVRRVC